MKFVLLSKKKSVKAKFIKSLKHEQLYSCKEMNGYDIYTITKNKNIYNIWDIYNWKFEVLLEEYLLDTDVVLIFECMDRYKKYFPKSSIKLYADDFDDIMDIINFV